MEESETLVMTKIQISCREVVLEISNFVDSEIPLELRARMEEHFRGCQHCTAILDGVQNIVGLVGDGKSFELPNGFGDRLKARLATVASDKKLI
jgi:hypothetical protein